LPEATDANIPANRTILRLADTPLINRNSSTNAAYQRGDVEADNNIPEAVNNIIKRLGEAAQKSPGMDNSTREQFMARLNSMLLKGAGEENLSKPDLLPLLGKMIEGLSKNTDYNSSELVKLAQNVMNKLEIIRGFNNKIEPGRDNIMVMYSSVRLEDKEEPFGLFINYRYNGKNKKRDFNSCSIEVKLQTPNLSLVRCEVQVNYKKLNLQFICDNERTGQLMDSVKQSLMEKLRQMNYQVASSATRVETAEDGSGFWFQDKPDKPGMFKINLRV